jgi:hypothetical protein
MAPIGYDDTLCFSSAVIDRTSAPGTIGALKVDASHLGLSGARSSAVVVLVRANSVARHSNLAMLGNI